jgi:hypothetical protein
VTGDPAADRQATEIGGPLALTAMTLGLVTWPIAFDLGAYGVVMYDDVFRIVVASTILCVITLVRCPYESPQRWLVPVALAGPLAWLSSASVLVGSTAEAMDRPAFVIALVAVLVVSVPITLKLLLDLFEPELVRARSRRLTLIVVGLVGVVALIGFLVGANNHRYMTCEDFRIAGASEPENCAR